jgi:hypothetical protein
MKLPTPLELAEKSDNAPIEPPLGSGAQLHLVVLGLALVADRLDTLIGLVFDDARAIHVRRAD